MDRLRKLTLLAACVLLAMVGCRKKEVMPARMGIEKNYSAIRLTPFRVSAGMAADSYRWVIDSVKVTENVNALPAKEAAAIRDSTVSEAETLNYTFNAVGIYFLTCRAQVKGGTIAQSFKVYVLAEFQSYKPWALLIDYRPALGEKVAEEAKRVGGDLKGAIRRANASIRRESNSTIYLGSFGGYATFEFDHNVKNFAGKYDFEVLRDIEDSHIGHADLVVWVSSDKETWYRLRSKQDDRAFSGSYADGPNGAAEHGDVSGFTSDNKYLFRAGSEEVPIPVRSAYPNLVPEWIEADWQKPYDGFRLKDRYTVKKLWTEDDPPVFKDFEVKDLGRRVYNDPPSGEEPNFFGMDIEWAVDAEGNPVSLVSIKYVKVSTGTLEAPKKSWIMEGSVTSVRDLNM